MVIAAASQAHSTELECRAVLHKCDDALNAQIEVNNLQKQIIADQEKRYEAQNTLISSSQIWKPIAVGGLTIALLEAAILIFKK